MPSVGGTLGLFTAVGNQPNEGGDAGIAPDALPGAGDAAAFLSILTGLAPILLNNAVGLGIPLAPLAITLVVGQSAGESASSQASSSDDGLEVDPVQLSIAAAMMQTFVLPSEFLRPPDNYLVGDSGATAPEVLAANSQAVELSAIADGLPETADANGEAETLLPDTVTPVVLKGVESSAERAAPLQQHRVEKPRVPPGEIIERTDFADGGKEQAARVPFELSSALALNVAADAETNPAQYVSSITADSQLAWRETESDRHDESAGVADSAVAATMARAKPSELPARPTLDTTSRTQFVHQVSEQFDVHLDQLRSQGRVEMSMNLHPPELGRMQMHLALEDNQLNVQMVVRDDAAKRALDQQLEPLRVHFAQIGVNLGQLDVRRDGDSQARNDEPTIDFEDAADEVRRSSGRRVKVAYAGIISADTYVDIVA